MRSLQPNYVFDTEHLARMIKNDESVGHRHD